MLSAERCSEACLLAKTFGVSAAVSDAIATSRAAAVSWPTVSYSSLLDRKPLTMHEWRGRDLKCVSTVSGLHAAFVNRRASSLAHPHKTIANVAAS